MRHLIHRYIFTFLALMHCFIGASTVPDSLCADKASRFFNTDNFDDALMVIDKCGNGYWTNRMRALIYTNLFNADSALFYIRKTIDISDKTDDSLYIAYGEALLWKKDFKAAMEKLGKVKNKSNFYYKRIAALYLEMVGKFDESLILYDSLLLAEKIKPWNIQFRKAQVLSWTKEFVRSELIYMEIINNKSAPLSVKMAAVTRKAEISAWRKETGRAISELNKLITDNKEVPVQSIEFIRLIEAMLLKGKFLEWESMFKAAKNTYSEILLLQPDNKQAKLSLENLLWVK